MRRFVVLLAAIAVMTAGGLTAVRHDASAAVSPSASPSVTTLRVGWLESPDNLNPFIGIQTSAYQLFHLNYDFLVQYDADTLLPVPGLAESWSHAADGKTWTFKLRKGVTWQDGEPFTADDVVFTFRLVIDTPMSSYSSYTQGITAVKAIDDHTVEFSTRRPKADILQMWVPIVPKHIWAAVGPAAAEKSFANSPPVVGTGPFQIVEWKRGEFVRLKANPDYWGGRPKVDEIVFAIYTNADTMAQDLKSGAIQYGRVDPLAFRSFGSTPGFTAHLAAEPGYDDLGFNCYAGPSKGNPVLRDPAFRRALGWAIDPAKIAAVAYSGSAVPATTILPSGYYDPKLDYHWQPGADVLRSYDPAKAKQLLDAAGYRDTNGDGIRDYKGKPIHLRFWSITDKPEYDLSGKLITGWFRDIGLQIEYRSMDEAALSDGIYNTEKGKFIPDYDMFLWNWNGDFDPGFLLSVLLTSQITSWSDTGWSNAEYDRLYQEQAATLDPTARRDIIWKMQAIVYDEAPYLPLVYPENRDVFATDGWTGWAYQPAKTGSVDNFYTFTNVHPVAGKSAGSGGSGALLPAVVAVAVVAVVAAIALALGRRRGRAVEE